MAAKRMFAVAIIDSDLFLDMPLTSQALYFHLSMRADDDGFVGNPQKIKRTIGASDDDMKLLIAKQFIIPFESGIVVIKHWQLHNYLRKDRYKETIYKFEKSQLTVDNDVYSIGIPSDNRLATTGIPCGNQLDTQISEDKNRIEKMKGRQTPGENRQEKGCRGREGEGEPKMSLPEEYVITDETRKKALKQLLG